MRGSRRRSSGMVGAAAAIALVAPLLVLASGVSSQAVTVPDHKGSGTATPTLSPSPTQTTSPSPDPTVSPSPTQSVEPSPTDEPTDGPDIGVDAVACAGDESAFFFGTHRAF